MVPAENTEIILGHRCEYTHIKNQPGALADPQMTFAFGPCKHYLLIYVEPEMVSLGLINLGIERLFRLLLQTSFWKYSH